MRTAPPDPIPHFSIAVEPDRAEVAVVPNGELDVSTIDALEHEVRELRDAGFAEILIDLRRITSIDSAGLQVLIALRDDASRIGHRLTLMPGTRQVRRFFDVTNTRGLFEWRLGNTPAPLSAPAYDRPTAA